MGTNIEDLYIRDTFDWVMHFGTNDLSAERVIQTGGGTESCLSISTNSATITGTFVCTGTATVGNATAGGHAMNRDAGDARWVKKESIDFNVIQGSARDLTIAGDRRNQRRDLILSTALAGTMYDAGHADATLTILGAEASGVWNLSVPATWNGESITGIKDDTGNSDPIEYRISNLTPGSAYSVFAAGYIGSNPAGSACVLGISDNNGLNKIVWSGTTVYDHVEFARPSGYAYDNNVLFTRQYVSFYANLTADQDGELYVYLDDYASIRCFMAGIILGDPLPEHHGTAGSETIYDGNAGMVWFNSPSVIRLENGNILTSTVNEDGEVEIIHRNVTTGVSTMYGGLFTAVQEDDHNQCSFLQLDSGNILACYQLHGLEDDWYYRISTTSNPTSVSDWGAEQTINTASASISYAQLHQLANGDIWRIGRDGDIWKAWVSTDGGSTWGAAVSLHESAGDSSDCYCHTASHGNRIHVMATDGRPSEKFTSIYHYYIEGGSFYRSDGTLIQTVASGPVDMSADFPAFRESTLYTYTGSAVLAGTSIDEQVQGRQCWGWDLTVNSDGEPVGVFYALYVDGGFAPATRSADDRHLVMYVRWDESSKRWKRQAIAHGGTGMADAYPRYPFGCAIDRVNPNRVWLVTNASQPFNMAETSIAPCSSLDQSELYRGDLDESTNRWTWVRVSDGSENAMSRRHLRPFTHANSSDESVVMWAFSNYSTYSRQPGQLLVLTDD